MAPRHETRTSWLVVVILGAGMIAGATSVLAQEETPPPTPTPTIDPVTATLGTVDAKLALFATQEARSAVGPIADKAVSDARVAAAMGRILEQEKRYDEAVVQLRKAAELAPDNAQNLVYLGEIYVRQRKDAEAAATFQRIVDVMQPKVEADATAWEPRYYLAIAQMRRKLFDPAAANFTSALALRPDHAMTLYYFGYMRALQQKWADAVDKLTKALTADPNLAYAYYYRGLAQDKLGKKDQLVIDMDRFLKLAPNTPEAERARGILAAAKR